MKGIVMEVSENTIFLLTDSGEFKEVRKPKESIMVGHEYNSKNYMLNINYDFFKNRKLAVIMLIAFLILPTTFSYTYFQPYGYINIDINPSVELTYNIFDRVINVKSINDDGIKIIEDNLDIGNMKITDAVESVIRKAENLGFINGDKDNLVLITVTSSDDKDVLKYEDESFESDEYEIEVIKASEEEHNEASLQGISTAELVIDKMIGEETSKIKKDKLIKLYEKFDKDFDDDDFEIDEDDKNKDKDSSDDSDSDNTKEEEYIRKEERSEKIEESKIEKAKELAEKRKIEREKEALQRKEELENARKERELERLKKEEELEEIREEAQKNKTKEDEKEKENDQLEKSDEEVEDDTDIDEAKDNDDIEDLENDQDTDTKENEDSKEIERKDNSSNSSAKNEEKDKDEDEESKDNQKGRNSKKN